MKVQMQFLMQIFFLSLAHLLTFYFAKLNMILNFEFADGDLTMS